MPKLVRVAIEDLVGADWNFKVVGTTEQIEKLAESIKRDGSAGVLAVREVDGFYEVLDGNHRLEAIKLLDWDRVVVENFGEISKAEAITIARRRNFEWFPTDEILLSKLIAEEVILEIPITDLAKFMPDTEIGLQAIVASIEPFKWEEESKNPFGESEVVGLGMSLDEKTYNLFEEIYELLMEQHDIDKSNLSVARGVVLRILLQSFVEKEGIADVLVHSD